MLELLEKYRYVEIKQRARDYLVDGERFSRVSAVLGFMDKPGLAPWLGKITLEAVGEALRDEHNLTDLRDAILETPGASDMRDEAIDKILEDAKERREITRKSASAYGTAVHEDIVAVVGGAKPKYGESVQALKCIADHGIAIEAQEMMLWDSSFKIAGTCDFIGRDPEGQIVVMDWKTGQGPYPEMALQLGAYSRMLDIITPEMTAHASIVKLTPDAYSVHKVRDLKAAQRVFIALSGLRGSLKQEWWA